MALEVLLVYEGVRRGGMQDAEGSITYLDDGFEEPGAAAEVRPQNQFVYRPTEVASRAARPSRSAAASWAML